ncbi:MAG: DNA-directed RNA polymerase subunit alpha, partial [Cocleimonas sp.]
MQNTFAGLLKPKLVEVVSHNENHSKIVIEPLERGFGHSLGNALRRVMLSSIPGCAVTEVEIEGVQHEYSSIEGVQEDVIDILLNLKNLAIVLHSKDEVELSLTKEGARVVTAADIDLPHDVEIVNPDIVLANLTDAGKLNLKMKVERNRGYIPASLRKENNPTVPVGQLLLDASFSPIKRVKYIVESTRVEQRTDLDKLIIDLETDGTVDPEETV